MPVAVAEQGQAAVLILAAGRHGHLIRLFGLGILVILVATVVALAIPRLIRHGRRRRPATPEPQARAAGLPLAGPPPAAAAAPPAAAPGSTPRPAVVAERLTKTYLMGKVQVRALDDVSVRVGDGAMTCIMGKSGSGKSTLLRQLGLIDMPESGRIWLHGQDVTGLAEHQRTGLRLRTLGYVFQEYALLPELTAAENVYLPAMMAGQPGHRCRARAAELLDLVGLGPRARHRPRELSGGEQQRVAIARALVNEPRIIFADEPTANLDTASARTVMQTLRTLNEALRVTVLFVSHDLEDAEYATQLIHLSDGRVSGTEPSPGSLSGARP